VTAQILDRVLTCYRIGDPNGEYPIFSAAGSRIAPGRWNTADTPLIYASEHYSTALLEKLVRGSGMLPPDQHCIEMIIPNGASYEIADTHKLKGWDDAGLGASRDYGATWARQKRSLVLIVPSVVARIDKNVLINPAHPEIGGVRHGLHHPVYWDTRLFRTAESDAGN
jgi:RES domain-containing protein